MIQTRVLIRPRIYVVGVGDGKVYKILITQDKFYQVSVWSYNLIALKLKCHVSSNLHALLKQCCMHKFSAIRRAS